LLYDEITMNEQPTLTPQPQVQQNKSRKGLKMFFVVILSLLAIGGAGYSVYAWQQNSTLKNDLSQKENDNKKLVEENETLQKPTDATVGNDDAQTTVVPDKELAQKAAQNFVDAQVLDMKYTVTAPEIKGNFASSSVAPATQPTHIVNGLLLKKVNETWVVIYDGQNGPDQETITRFAIPKEFQS
jgi:uncharacterized protein HemX